MVIKESVARTAGRAVDQGLARLMMRLPATRPTIRAAVASDSELCELCGTYGEACALLDVMRRDSSADPMMIADYEGICRDIEAEFLLTLIGEE
ncbi:nodulation protein [Rhizobium sp. R635]|uniref:nodulation protein n=1 Tax=Rhizobium sp. R635 TaxID=1764275 RepID=UPI000B52D6C8|nr:nodulation protein [Rhizobium sp. R635]OWV78194.1 nodulation protein [Rhizobium sp. R635]